MLYVSFMKILIKEHLCKPFNNYRIENESFTFFFLHQSNVSKECLNTFSLILAETKGENHFNTGELHFLSAIDFHFKKSFGGKENLTLCQKVTFIIFKKQQEDFGNEPKLNL